MMDITVRAVASALMTLGIASCSISASKPTALPGALSFADRCTALSNRILGGGRARVTSAAVVPAAGGAPDYCVVKAAFAKSALKVEARLPLSGWNERLAFLGGGASTAC